MRLVNRSSYPTDEIRKLVGFCDSSQVTSKITVLVVDGKGGGWYRKYARGHCLPNGEEIKNVNILVRLRTGRQFPYRYHYPERSQRFPTYTVKDWKEEVVSVLSHEVHHHKLYLQRDKRLASVGMDFAKRKKIRNMKRWNSERRCELAAEKALMKWRAVQFLHPTPLMEEVNKLVQIETKYAQPASLISQTAYVITRED